MQNELGEKIMTKFGRLRAKTYSYLIDNSRQVKRAEGAKKCLIKPKLKSENYKNCLKTSQLENKKKLN